MNDKIESEDEDRAADLTKKAAETSTEHEGNRVTADDDAPQPTREPTRDQSN
jgi:hypothetical protein